MSGHTDVRTVLGLTAESWAIGCFSLVVVAICCQELGRFFASLSAVRVPVKERNDAMPAWRHEAVKAKRGVWR